MDRRACVWAGLFALTVTGLACKSQVQSPTPVATSLTPSLACGEQLTTEIRLAGDNLSPLPLDVLTDDPGLALPDLWVQRTATLTGDPVEEALVDLDESEAAGRVRWLSQEEMRFDVFPELGLEPGLYDLYARNADGQTVQLASALTIVPRPTLTAIEPKIACGEQIDNVFVLTGTTFLVVDGVRPTVAIGAASLTPDEVDGCFDLPGPTNAQACTQLTVTLPAGTLEPAIVDVVVTNPEPAGCMSTDAVQVEIVPPPTVSSIEPALACLEQGDRAFTVTGTGYLVLAQNGEDALPSVTVGDVTVRPGAVAGCSDLQGPAPGRRCTELSIVLPSGSLDPGLQLVTVTNPEPAQCISEEDVRLEVVPPPTLTSVEPALICSEQHENELVLTGTGFLLVPGQGDEVLPPTVHFGDALTVSATGAEGCELLPGTVGASSCTTLTVTVPEDALAAEIYDVSVTNPEPAGCTSTESVQLQVIPPPTLAAIEPALACVAQGERAFTVTGTGFLVLETDEGDAFPEVAVGDATVSATDSAGCTALAGPVAGRLCSELTLALAEDALDPGLHDVVVTNPPPADCASTEGVQLEVIPPPVLAAIEPILACVEGNDRSFAVTGTGFLVVEGEADAFPTVSFGDVDVVAEADNEDCSDLAGTVAGRLCTGLTVTVPAGSLEAGMVAVSVTNPPPGGCTSTEAVDLEVVPPAEVTTLTPQLVCGEQFENTFTATGTGFLVFDDGEGGQLLPTVQLGDFSGAVDGVDGCTDRSDSPFGGQSCTEVSFTLPADATAAGVHVARIINPPPADCASTGDVEVQVLGAPVVDQVIPAGLCTEFDQAVLVTLLGSGFLSLGDSAADWPTVTIGGQGYDVDGLTNCVALEGPVTGELCEGVELTLQPGAFDDFDVPIVVTNPPIAQCASPSTDAPVVESVPPPSITGFEPDPVCDDATTFAILGTDFQIGATVEILSPIDGQPVPIDSVNLVLGDPDPDRLEIVVPEPLVAGLYTVTVENPDGCNDTAVDFLEVVTGPFLFNVDPPVAYREIRTLMTLYVAGVTDEITDVWIVEDATGTRTDLTFTYDPGVNENVVFAELPAGTLPEGSYTVFIEDTVSCPDFLEGVLYVEADLTVAIDTINPPFGWTSANTAVDITAMDPAPSGEVQFQDVPRVYLSPRADDAAVARLVRSVNYRSATRLTAVVPDGLPSGAYDVVVVNPDGSIGVADQPFVVTEAGSPPPAIASVSPVRVSSSSDVPLTIDGAYFRADAEVTFECLAPGAATPTTISATGVTVNPAGTRITATFPAASASLVQGTSCVVVVTEASTALPDIVIDTPTEYSAVAVISPSGNLFATESGPTLNVPRRGLSAAALRATNTARFVYAIGGDDPTGGAGNTPVTYTTVEAVALDRFGNFEDDGWLELPHPLAVRELAGRVDAPRTQAGTARVGHFVFVVGGNDGSQAVDTVLRAQILDPLAAPVFDTVGLELVDSGGLAPGTWIYKIAAVFADDDLVNPGGESLPSDPIVVRVPDLNPEDDESGNDNNRVNLSVSWEAVDRAVAYRVYRSPAPGAASGTEAYLAEVSALSFTDTGGATATDPDVTACSPGLADICPRALGELGEWAVVAALPGTDAADGAREAPCVIAAADPDDPDGSYLYVGGGRDGNGSIRDTITVIPLARVSDDVQTVSTPWTSANTLDTARWECGGFGVGGWVYFGPGRVSAASATSDNDAGRVVGNGECSALFDGCVAEGQAECDVTWQQCFDACAGDGGCEAGCAADQTACYDQASTLCGADLAECDAVFPAGELVCTATLDGANNPCLVAATGRANAGYGPASTGSFLFQFGGTASSGNNDDRIFESEVQGPPDLGSWTPSGDVSFSVGRRYMGMAQESGLIFIIGGELQNGTRAVTGGTLTTL